MSEWTSVIAVYWVLWAIDGLRLARTRSFAIRGGERLQSARVHYNRWVFPAVLPTGWRLGTADVPFALAPAGLSNQPIGSTGRPAESPPRIQAWRWEEVRDVRSNRGWLRINGKPFCPDTGHLTPSRLRQLAQRPPAAREHAIRALVRGWFRPAHLRRRVRVLVGRTWGVAACNLAAFVLTALLSVYALADIATRMPEERAAAIASILPGVVGLVFALHVTAIVLAVRARRRMRRVTRDFRPSGFMSAALLPPQALRLRALLGENFFPATHPFAAIAAVAQKHAVEEAAFHTMADLRWPIAPPADDPALAPRIASWFTAAVEAEVVRLTASAQLPVGKLLQPPQPDTAASCCYCPRCHAQFVDGAGRCPHGIELLPLGTRRQ